jgi:hypothetical protein
MIQISEQAANQIIRLKTDDKSAASESFLRVKVVAG